MFEIGKYQWVSEESTKCHYAVLAFNEILNETASPWEMEWFDYLGSWDNRNNIYKQLLIDKAHEFGFLAEDSNNLALLTEDQMTVCRANVQVTFAPIRKLYAAVFPGNMIGDEKRNTAYSSCVGNISQYSDKIKACYIDNGNGGVQLREGWEDIVRGFFIYTIPQAYRPLFDLITENQEVFDALYQWQRNNHSTVDVDNFYGDKYHYFKKSLFGGWSIGLWQPEV